MEIVNENKKIKHKQIILASITLGVVFVIILVFLLQEKKKPDDINQIINSSKNKIIIEDPGATIKAEDRWFYNAEKKLEDYDQFKKESSESKSSFEDRLNKIEKDYQAIQTQQAQLIEEQNSQIEELKGQLVNLKTKPNDPATPNNPNFNNSSVALPKTIQALDFNLEKNSPSKNGHYKISEYVPAGSYAPATIISGVDASVGISSQSDPRPVLLRINGPATSSIYDGNVKKSDLTGCLITGAASGDLSSEKVYVKLVKMTCSKDEETVVETAVKGYVAGQGKSGVRGNVISREGDLITKSFLAGLIGGFGQGLAEKVAPPLNFSNGLTTQSAMTTADVAKKGLGRGFATSSDRIANYMINRAEQYQPVVSIPSGIDVEIVFVDGFYMDNRTIATNQTQNHNELNNQGS